MTSNAPSSADRAGHSKKLGLWVMVQTVVVLAATFAVAALAARAGHRPAVNVMPTDEASVWGFLAAFAAVTALVLILTRHFKKTKFLEAVFLLAVFTGIGSALVALFGTSVAMLGTSAAVFLYYFSRSVLTFDLLLALGCAGIAANLGGAMHPTGVAVIIAVLAVYDIVAVYVTKHMVEMAEAMLRRKVFFAMILSERPGNLLLPVTTVTSGSGFIFLGTGDVVLPALLVASVSVIDARAAVLVATGALCGAVVLHLVFLSQHERRPMPALPPIAVGALLGFVASFFLTSAV